MAILPLLREIEKYAQIIQKGLCGYGTEQGPGLQSGPEHCDCKFLCNPVGGGEETGCCEARSIILAVREIRKLI